MKDLKIAALIDIYGGMLTDKQAETAKQYYESDFSLFEISQNMKVSRQAVFAALKQAQNTLKRLEERLGFYKKTEKIRRLITDSLSGGAGQDPYETVREIEKIL
jgi:predicted DNA-binding protein YlxM (UPF0122 family)